MMVTVHMAPPAHIVTSAVAASRRSSWLYGIKRLLVSYR